MARLIQTLALFFLLLLTQVSAETNFFITMVDRNGGSILPSGNNVPKIAPKGSAEITSLSFETSSPLDANGRVIGKLRASVFKVNRTADTGSAAIFAQQVANQQLKTVTVTGFTTSPTGTADVRQTYTLTDAFISSFSQGPLSDDGVLSESISFTFAKLELKTGTITTTFDPSAI